MRGPLKAASRLGARCRPGRCRRTRLARAASASQLDDCGRGRVDLGLANELAQDPQGTKRLAEEESRSRSTGTAVLIAAVASLAAVAEALVRSSSNQDASAITLVVLSIVAAILSWALVNSLRAQVRPALLRRRGRRHRLQAGPAAHLRQLHLHGVHGRHGLRLGRPNPRTPTSARSFSATRCCPTPSVRASSPWPLTS